MTDSVRTALPAKGTDWATLQTRMEEMGESDVDWRSGRAAVYVFHAGEDVLQVAKEAYALYQSENGLGPAAFPSLARMEGEVIDMGLDLLHAPPGACGNLTSGGTESILMAVKTCRDQAAANGVDPVGAEIIVPWSAHLAFDKAAGYFGLEIKRVPLGEDLRADVAAMAAAITDRTIMIVGSAPCFPYGLIDPIDALSDLALERGLWLHVDACVGGYFNGFARMNGVDVEPFDFELPGVASISADLHKYGYAAKGASTIFHRTEAQREYQLFVCDTWPAGLMRTPTAAGTRPGGAIAAAWAVMNYLGVDGYREKARMVCEARERIARAVEAIPELAVIAPSKLGLIAYGMADGCSDFGIFDVWARLKARGWFTGVVTQPPGIHLMLSPAHLGVVGEYIADLEAVVQEVRAGARAEGEVEARYS
jgi:glutamate/tyrosine decarboxylase-like PLP-dependent enzyme